jgi:inner membrane protein
MAIGSACCLPFNPSALPMAIIGSTAPDWSEWVLKFFGINVEHRGATHYIIVPLFFILFSFIYDIKDLIFWFGVGYLSHWFADSLTISGVPLTPWDTSRIHFFGGKLRTGDLLEYVISFSLLAMSVTVAKPMAEGVSGFFGGEEKSFSVYSMDYEELNKRGIIDNKEFLESRFKFF